MIGTALAACLYQGLAGFTGRPVTTPVAQRAELSSAPSGDDVAAGLRVIGWERPTLVEAASSSPGPAATPEEPASPLVRAVLDGEAWSGAASLVAAADPAGPETPATPIARAPVPTSPAEDPDPSADPTDPGGE
jgi:hypothetical protein